MVWQSTAGQPAPSDSRLTRASPEASTSSRTSWAPASANVDAMERPIPDEAPVMSTRRPVMSTDVRKATDCSHT